MSNLPPHAPDDTDELTTSPAPAAGPEAAGGAEDPHDLFRPAGADRAEPGPAGTPASAAEPSSADQPSSADAPTAPTPATDATQPTERATAGAGEPTLDDAPATTTAATAGAGRSWARTFLVGVAVGALVGGAVGGGVAAVLDDDAPAATGAQTRTAGSLPVLEGPADVREIASAVAPSVVSIQTRSVGLDSVLQPFAQEGAGSGFIVTPEGLIITNNHVVEGARSITVTTADGEEHTATVLGRDPSRDLAVLDIDASGLTPLPLGDSDALVVGDSVVAIGNALGLGDTPTVTTGIVSALERTISVDSGITLEHLIQTDAAINPGNSGGPLVNTAGEVVGINTAIAGNAENIGFAIAINSVKDVIDQLQSGEVPRSPFLGVQSVTVDADIAARFDLGVERGALVIAVTEGSGAELAGISRGDVILEIDGRSVETAEDLAEIVGDLEPDQAVDIVVDRDGEEMTLQATIGERAGSLG